MRKLQLSILRQPLHSNNTMTSSQHTVLANERMPTVKGLCAHTGNVSKVVAVCSSQTKLVQAVILQLEADSPEKFGSSSSKAHHVVGDGAKQQGLDQVVGQLNKALGQGKGQFMVHARRPLPVHDAALCEGHRLHSHRVDDAQEKHGQVQATQNVAQVLCCRPADTVNRNSPNAFLSSVAAICLVICRCLLFSQQTIFASVLQAVTQHVTDGGRQAR